jgi:hypothetical protein
MEILLLIRVRHVKDDVDILTVIPPLILLADY